MFRYNNRATKDNPLNDSDRFLLACLRCPIVGLLTRNSRARLVKSANLILIGGSVISQPTTVFADRADPSVECAIMLFPVTEEIGFQFSTVSAL